ncbi:hypothetical protein [Bdellovibrio sp. HCB2-146]|uniref:hypothetical protein n=1 Tax=Bdellovibrio sp. HCB2-146 TaxID=3394362 RepID=UPI0039BD893B
MPVSHDPRLEMRAHRRPVMNAVASHENFISVKYGFILALILSPILSFAMVAEKRSDRLFLRDNDCSLLINSVMSLKKWTEATEGRSACSSISRTNLVKGCEIDITDCVPAHVLKYQGVAAKEEGPNCYNLALVMKGILPALRFSPSDEMSFYMRPPLCRALNDNEQRKPGDVGAIREAGINAEVHGFIYIDENVAYTKNGNEIQPYMLDSFKELVKGYALTENPACWTSAKSKPPECKKTVSYFRCDSMEDYLKKNPDLSPEILKIFDQVENFEECLSDSAVHGKMLSAEAKSSIVNTSKALVFYLRSERAKHEIGKNPENDFILGALQLRLRGIAGQLNTMEQENLADTVWDLNAMVRKSAEDLKSSN